MSSSTSLKSRSTQHLPESPTLTIIPSPSSHVSHAIPKEERISRRNVSHRRTTAITAIHEDIRFDGHTKNPNAVARLYHYMFCISSHLYTSKHLSCYLLIPRSLCIASFLSHRLPHPHTLVVLIAVSLLRPCLCSVLVSPSTLSQPIRSHHPAYILALPVSMVVVSARLFLSVVVPPHPHPHPISIHCLSSSIIYWLPRNGCDIPQFALSMHLASHSPTHSIASLACS
ncbi:hypothetical protein C8Q80DRAFT_224276 [Daedaleopsis nitida]|nr:hypothetical protein C8Q80DRAFT_224276 [Daedaleopsis nitida]